jgi:CBS domain-containing protein
MPEQGQQFDLRELFTTTTVSELAISQVPTLDAGQTAEQAAVAMRAVSHGSALICEAGRLVGIVTERDLLKLIAEDSRFRAPLREIMTTAPQTVRTDSTLLEAVRLMDRGGYRRLPVVDDDRRPIGIVDVKSVVTYLVEQIPGTIYNQASVDLSSVRDREGA